MGTAYLQSDSQALVMLHTAAHAQLPPARDNTAVESQQPDFYLIFSCENAWES